VFHAQSQWLVAFSGYHALETRCYLRCSQNPPQESPKQRGFSEAGQVPFCPSHHAWPGSSCKGGRAAIERCRLERPDVYIRVIASLLPKQEIQPVNPRRMRSLRSFSAGAMPPEPVSLNSRRRARRTHFTYHVKARGPAFHAPFSPFDSWFGAPIGLARGSPSGWSRYFGRFRTPRSIPLARAYSSLLNQLTGSI
jgi:hypothetical protein